MDTYTIDEIYIKACELVDTNTQNQVHLDMPRFVIFFNHSQNEFLKSTINTLRSSDLVEVSQRFLQPVNIQQDLAASNAERKKYIFPSDFIKHEKVTAKIVKENCGSEGFYVNFEEAKPTDVDRWMLDSNRRPSFEFRESFYYVATDGVWLYTDGTFDFRDVELIYYRFPRQIDIAGYEKEDGSPSTNIQTEWSRTEVESILQNMVSLYTVAQLPIKQE